MSAEGGESLPDAEPKARLSHQALNTTLGLAALIIWSTTIAVSRSLSEKLGPFTCAAAIYGGGGVLSVLFLAGRRGALKEMLALPRAYLLICGGLFAVYMVLLYVAIGLATDRTAAVVVGIINYLWPALTLVFAVPILGQRANWLLLPGTVLAFAGIAVAGLGGQRLDAETLGRLQANLLPFGCALGAALCWGLYSNCSRRFGGEHAGGVPLFLIASGLLLGLVRLGVTEEAHWSAETAVELLFMILMPAALGYVLWDRAVRRGNLVLLAIASYFVPICSTVFYTLYLGQRLETGVWAGCVLVSAGAIVCKLAFRAEGDGGRAA